MKKLFLFCMLMLTISVLMMAQSIHSNGLGTIQNANPGSLTSSGVELYNQLGDTGSGLISQKHDVPADGIYDAESADDFVVPVNLIWSIDKIVVETVIYGNFPSPLVQFTVNVYDNNSNLPGSLLKTLTFNVNAANFLSTGEIPLPQNIVLTEGTYWISVIANYGSVSLGDRYFWMMNSTGTGNNAVLRNPNGGFDIGSGWVDIETLLPYNNLSFALYGSESNTVPFPIYSIIIIFVLVGLSIILRKGLKTA